MVKPSSRSRRLQSLAARGELESGQVNHGAVGSVLARNPLWVIECKIPRTGGIFSLAWKILRGVEVASTKRVMVGGAADQLAIEKNRTQTTPKILESFIMKGPHSFDEPDRTALAEF